MTAALPPLWILSGKREAGKTSFCRRLISAAQGRGIDTAGLISPAIFIQGKKIGFNILNVRTGESRPLAQLRGEEMDGIVTHRWKFDESNFTWGAEVLADSVPCGLLVVDELGPLELEQGRGWVTGIAALSGQEYTAAVVVIRPELTAKAKSLWSHAGIVEIDPIQSHDEETQLVEKILLPFLKT